MKIKKENLKKTISKFANKRILVVGDLILDRHVFGQVNRISPEAPVPVVWAKSENFKAGGAANVGMNLIDLGAQVTLCGLTGTDEFGQRLRSLLSKKKLATNFIFKDKNRRTTLKTRIIAHHQQVVRLDWESNDNFPEKITKNIIDKLKNNFNKFDAVIVEDYGKGVVNPLLIKELISLCDKKNKIITVDPKEDHFQYYRGVTTLTPNLNEAQIATGMKARNKNEIKNIGKKLLNKLKPKSILLTLGEDGMMLFEKKKIKHIPTAALEVYDVTGAGDTVISLFTLALASGATSFEAAQIANLGAGSVVGQLGAATINKKELIKIINEKRN
ncbi:MAG: D-glycero-beta-D-manno-heptose-7-phosphate kinase [Candidatus Omnitrophica bacterium]|nr:D-glycero-beta-D-manno-heptose-7-phosphate kinase [Candidatus Omnitrophota bacterium]MCF7877051.1 D-glycero-beta-D-manno-heptose-7-phosphate kinase [Candidatus Omnitrophota bacterium]MCF7891400.1 D-glycero-beta-D-manno-heptose-7-phosphate kinase [Candidatus Omnitrophota bacterium]MCF7897924.1 D-glycero-beta-D-manno-heptose-7-phosphate kinase [Candidatus Omnitrophota bacterium]MCF7909015.1 D-glycero-beta-D-manno-heptose-7-phosphate kinase [Candidatus Omnitrophota bacterium]